MTATPQAPHGRTAQHALSRAAMLARLVDGSKSGGGGLPRPVEVPIVPTLKTPRLTLRPLLESDRERFAAVAVDNIDHLSSHCPLAMSDRAEADLGTRIVEHQLALSDGARRTALAWRMIAIDEAGDIVGAVNINDISRGLQNSGELVFWTSRNAQGRGYAKEIVRAAIDHALADLPGGLGLHRVRALVAPTNVASVRVLSSAGLRLAPNHPTAALVINGQPVLHDVYVIHAQVPFAGQLEGKPSIARNIFGTGLLAILRTEASQTPE